MLQRSIGPFVVLSALVFAGVSTTGCGALLKKSEPAPAPNPADMEKLMAEMARLAEPGPQHAALQQRVGKWNLDETMYMDGVPNKANGTAECTSIVGGRFVVEHHHGTAMGMPFEGFGIAGFDNRTQEHTMTWVDSFGTYTQSARGKEDASGWIELKGIATDAFSPEGRPFRWRFKTESKDKRLLEVIDSQPDGKGGFTEMKVVDITYTRASG